MKTQISLILAGTLIVTPCVQAQRTGAAGAAAGRGVGAAGRGGPVAAGARNPAGAAARGNSPGNASSPANQSGNAPASNQPANNNGPDNSSNNNNMWSVADHILNSDSLSADTENGIFQWNNSKFSVGENLAVRMRFERYLSSPGFDNTAEYQKTLDQIQNLLSTNTAKSDSDGNPVSGDRIYQAWQLLYVAAKFPQDGGASETLANQVFNAWRVRDELASNKVQYTVLDDQRQHQEAKVANAGEAKLNNALTYAEDHPVEMGTNPTPGSIKGSVTMNQLMTSPPAVSNGTSSGSSGGNSGGSGGGTGSGTVGANGSGPDASLSASNVPLGGSSSPASSGEAQMREASKFGVQSAELARTYAKMALVDADATGMVLKAKTQYQTQLVTYIAERRFQHSLIAGMFYEHIFNGSQQRMEVAKEEISKFINTDSIVPSVNSFEFISHEAMAEVNTGMKAVENAFDRGDRWIALQQLQQTFLLGENLPPVQNFDPAKRRVLLGIYTAGTALKHMIEIRDFAGAEDKVNKISVDARDFADADAGPILSAIKEGEQTSNNLVLAAKQAALTGDADRVNETLQKATELWPLNPEIAKFSNTLLDRTNLANIGAEKFRELYDRGDHRAIYDAKDEIGAAIYQDPVLAGQFKKIVNSEMQVDMAITMANQAMKQNNGYAAWEVLMNASELEPNDPVLNRTEKDVASRVAPFVAALDAASRAEKAGEYAASLNYYLQAEDIYPASQICHDAIENLSLKIMAKANPSGASAKLLTKQEADKAAAEKADSTTGAPAS